MSDRLAINDEYDAGNHGLSSADINDLQDGIEIAAAVKTGSIPVDHGSKTYSRPTLRHLGCLSTLIMGMSGAGIDSVARREF